MPPLSREFEAGDGAALWVHRPENVFDRAVLPGCVAALQTDEQGALAFRVHQVLEVAELFAILVDFGQRALVGFMLVLEPCVNLAEIDLAVRLDAKSFKVVHDPSPIHFVEYRAASL